MKLSIVIPCYNEAENIPLVLEEYSKVISRDDIEVIIVNNGSTDGTGTILDRLSEIHGRFMRAVTVEKNQGYGYGILSGLKAAKGEFIGWTHGDLQTPPQDVLKALDIIEKSNSNPLLYIKGTRQNRPAFDQMFTYGMTVFETAYLGTWLYDINAQPNIFHRRFFESWKNPPNDFSLDLYALYMAKKQGLAIIRFPVDFLRRIHGQSKWNTSIRAKWKFIRRTVEFSVGLKKQLRS